MKNLKQNKVNLIVLGFQKSGTTTIADYLNKHEEVNFCSQKEPFFFSNNKNWKKNLEQYHELFKKNKDRRIWAEASTNYVWLFDFPHVPANIKAYNSKMKFIIIMRDPVYRMISHYNYYKIKGYTNKTRLDAINSDPIYINNGMYALQIEPYIELFPRENFLFLTLEEFKNNAKFELDKIANFLSISPFKLNSKIKVSNKTSSLKKTRLIKKKIAPYFRFLPIWIRKLFLPLFQYDIKIHSELSHKEYLYFRSFFNKDILKMQEITQKELEKFWVYKKN